jgi:hypothetical protein
VFSKVQDKLSDRGPLTNYRQTIGKFSGGPPRARIPGLGSGSNPRPGLELRAPLGLRAPAGTRRGRLGPRDHTRLEPPALTRTPGPGSNPGLRLAHAGTDSAPAITPQAQRARPPAPAGTRRDRLGPRDHTPGPAPKTDNNLFLPCRATSGKAYVVSRTKLCGHSAVCLAYLTSARARQACLASRIPGKSERAMLL